MANIARVVDTSESPFSGRGDGRDQQVHTERANWDIGLHLLDEALLWLINGLCCCWRACHVVGHNAEVVYLGKSDK
jgi:hypothetical protein